MKQHSKWFVGALAVAGGLMMANSVDAQSIVVSDFSNNFGLNVTYGNWDADGSQTFNGGSGYAPTLSSTAAAASFQVNAQGQGSGHYDISSGSQQLLGTDINQVTLSLTLNNISHNDAWMGIKFLLSDNQGNSDIWYGTYVGVFGVDNGSWEGGNIGTASWSGETLTMTAPLTSAMMTAVQTGNDKITGFSLVFDPAYYAPGSFPAYNVTYDSLSLSAAPTPEPASLALLGVGAVGLVIARRRAKKS